MSLTLLQRKKLHASIFGYLSTAEGGALFVEAAEAFRRESGLSEDDCTKLVSKGALETKWKTKRQLEIDLLKVKEWIKGQLPQCTLHSLPPLLGDTELDDGSHPSTSGDDPSTDHQQHYPHPHEQHHHGAAEGDAQNASEAGRPDSVAGTCSADGGKGGSMRSSSSSSGVAAGSNIAASPPSGVGSGVGGGGGAPRQRRRCVETTCSAFPRWGNCSRDVFGCDAHKLPGMVDLRRRNCESPGCSKSAGFGFEGGDTMRFCSVHKEPGMVNLRGKRCEAPGCRRHPLYGYEGERRQFCKTHREEGMVYKVGNNCQVPECSRQARFGDVGEEARFCMEHKKAGMMDVHHRLCEEPHCKVPYP